MTDDLTPCDNSLCACHDAAISTVSKHGDKGEPGYPHIGYTVSYRKDPYDEPAEEGIGWVVAKDGDEIIGALQWDYEAEPPYVVDMSVDEKYRRRGIGTRLFNEAKKQQSGLVHSQTLTGDGREFVSSFAKHGRKGEPGYPHPMKGSQREFADPDWSPTMTRDEAEVWAKDSSIHVPLTFVGKRPSLERIRESGFHDPLSDNRKHSAGSVWGAGIYLGFADVEAEVDDYDSDWLDAHEEWETRYDQAIAAADLADTIRGQELDAQRYPDEGDPTISFNEYSVGLKQSRAQREADIEQWRAANPEPDPPTTLSDPSISQYGPMKLEYPTDLDWKKYDEAFAAWSQRKGEALGMGGLNLIPLTAEWNDAARAYAEANPAPTAPGANSFAQAVLVRANLSKVAHINIPPNDGGYSSQTRIRAIPGVNEVAASEFNLGPDDYIYTEVYGKILRHLGYDALLITQYEDKIFVGDDGVPQDRRVLLTDEGQGYDGGVGGPQLIVWDPTKLTVISDETPRYMDPVYKHGNKGDPDYPHKPRVAAKRTPKKVDPKVAVQQAISSPPPPWTNQTWWNTVEGNFAKAILDHPDDLSPEVLESWNEVAKENAAYYKIYTRVTPRVLGHVLEDGQFRSQHETGSSNGMYSPRSRAIAEYLLHGVDVENTDPGTIFGYADRTGYGFVDAALEDGGSWGESDPVSQYGSIAIEFNDDLRSRTTMTIGDSLDQSGVFVVGRTLASEIGGIGPRLHEYGWGVSGEKDSVRFSPVPLDNPTYHAWGPEVVLGGWSAGDPSDWAEGAEPYVEAQFHGGVNISDIKRVIVPQDDMTYDLLDALRGHDIPFQVLKFDSDNGVQDVTDEYTGDSAPEPVSARINRNKSWLNTHGYAGQTIPVPNSPYIFKVIEKDFDAHAGLKPAPAWPASSSDFGGVAMLQVEALHPDDGSQMLTALAIVDMAATAPEFEGVQYWAGDTDPLDDLRTYLTAIMSGTALAEVEGQDALFKHGTHDQRSHGRRGSASALRRRGKQGGFTFHPTTVRYPSSGYAVATPGHSKIFTPSAFTDEALVDYIDSHAATLAANPALHLGGWYDRTNDEMVLDLVEVFDKQDQAVQAGRNRNEQAIFDLKNLAEISTGGTGGREDLAVVGKSGRGWSALQLAVDVAGGEVGLGEAGEGGVPGLAPSFLKHATHDQKTHGNRDSAPREWDHLLDRMFPDGALRTSILPWRRMPPRLIGGDRVYDMETVLDGLDSEVTDVDTNDLHANQGAVTRAGVSHYLDPATRDTIYGSSNKVNKIPTIYRRRDGRNVILSGHHRAAAAWLRQEPLRARVIHERAFAVAKHGTKGTPNYPHRSRVTELFGDEQKISIFKPGLFAGPMAEARVWDPEGEEFYDEKYDLDIIREMLPTAPTRMVDPSQLRATQSTLTRVALEHYLSSDEKFSRRSDQSKVTGLNDIPVGWLNSDGTINIVSGHHRAAAALLKGVPLKMRIIDQTVHKHGTKGSPGYSILHPRTRTGEINPVTITDRARNNAADWMAERDLDQVTLYANTAAILDRADARSLDYGRDWYGTAHRVAVNVAEAGGIEVDIAAAILAALSPRNKWRYPDDEKYLTHGNVADAFKLVNAINNPILVELDAAEARKASKMYKIDIAPGEYWTDQVDAKTQAAIDPRVVGMPDNLVKAFRLARGEGSADDILGGPKVRSFYNNILLVDESASATIDSHQVRAMIGRIDLPDKVYEEIASNPARYEYFADVVRALAADRNIPPHVVQAITWEQWRLEHPEDVRAKENASNIASAKDVTLGSITYDAPTVAKTPLREGD